MPLYVPECCQCIILGFQKPPVLVTFQSKKGNEIHNITVTAFKQFSNSSLEESLHMEIESYEDLDGIDAMTDARNGWRKNAKDSSVVALGEQTH